LVSNSYVEKLKAGMPNRIYKKSGSIKPREFAK